MKKWVFVVMACTAFCGFAQGDKGTLQAAHSLEAGFSAPPFAAKPQTWWHWMNGNATREGITADLEAIQRVGLGGVTMFNVFNAFTVDVPAGPAPYMSPEWMALVQFAIEEAGRLGLDFNMSNSAGWSGSGGPWVPPEHSMKILTWSEVHGVTSESVVQLPQPKSNRDFYEDIVVWAFPTPTGEMPPVIIGRKHGFGGPVSHFPDWNLVPDDAVIPLDQLVEVTEFLKPSGELVWTPPSGSWTVIRIGFTTNGQETRPAPLTGTGLECDKFSRAGLDAHWAGGIQPLLDRLKSTDSSAFKHIVLDSFEAGQQNWTDAMPEEFLRLRGYDLKPYLLTFTGRAVRGAEASARFVWDFKRTSADLVAMHHYSYFAEKCHAAGLNFACEPYGNGDFESMSVANDADLLMAEFWVNRGIHDAGKLVSSVAHTQGKTIVGAESFTAQPQQGKWQNHPGSLKRTGDLFWCHGINRFIFHSYAHQPWLDHVPGMTMGQWGTNFGRTSTWWEKSGPWIDYLTRSQFLLQSGTFQADVLFFIGETAPSRTIKDDALRAAGYDYDVLGTDLLDQLRVDKGEIVLPSGMRYRLLVLPMSTTMTPEALQVFQRLLRDGATILGNRPDRSPSLVGYPECDDQVTQRADSIWGNEAASAGMRSVESGSIYWGTSPIETLQEMGVQPDFECLAPSVLLTFIHRNVDGQAIYFVAYQGETTQRVECAFRVDGREPEIWNAENGSVEPAQDWVMRDGRTFITLPLETNAAFFVVFRKPTEATESAVRLEDSVQHVQPLDVPWNVHFTPGWDAPDQIVFEQLMDWTAHTNEGIRFYSGTATYQTTFTVGADFMARADSIDLDLGTVHCLAEVVLNGKELGTCWFAPYRINVAKALVVGENRLEVRVTNQWTNRLIGEEHYPNDMPWVKSALKQWPDWLVNGTPRPSKKRRTFRTWKHFNADSPLLPAGLIGPVQLRSSYSDSRENR